MNVRIFAAAAIATVTIATSAGAATVLINGSFETGDFTGWTTTVASGSNGNIGTTTGGTSPLSSTSIDTPTDGTYYTVTDQAGPGAYSLMQSFVATASMMLSFDFFAQTSAALFNNGDLDFLTGSNQHARVDILTDSAGAFDVGASIVQVLIAPVANTSPSPFASYSFALNSLTVGTTYQLRFAQVDNEGFFQMGVDNVKLTTAVVPVPAAGLMLVGALGGLAALGRRKALAA